MSLFRCFSLARSFACTRLIREGSINISLELFFRDSHWRAVHHCWIVYVKLMIAYNNLMHKHLFNVTVRSQLYYRNRSSSCFYWLNDGLLFSLSLCHTILLLSLCCFLFVRSSSAFSLVILFAAVCECVHTHTHLMSMTHGESNGKNRSNFDVCVCACVHEWISSPCGFYIMLKLMYNNNHISIITWVYRVHVCVFGSQMEIIIMNKYLDVSVFVQQQWLDSV